MGGLERIPKRIPDSDRVQNLDLFKHLAGRGTPVEPKETGLVSSGLGRLFAEVKERAGIGEDGAPKADIKDKFHNGDIRGLV